MERKEKLTKANTSYLDSSQAIIYLGKMLQIYILFLPCPRPFPNKISKKPVIFIAFRKNINPTKDC